MNLKAPYTRGIQLYVSFRLWTMRQYAGFSSAEETNERFRYSRTEGLSVAFDTNSTRLDADDEMSEGEVGK